MRLAIIVFLSLFPCVGLTAEELNLDAESRDNYLQRAQVWQPVEVTQRNILAGPKTEISVPLDTVVECEYVEWKKKPSGVTPKLECKLLKNGQQVRVKYGFDTREIYAEVAASRLFWALGFMTDSLYPVKIRCLKCPEKDPFKPEKDERRIEKIFEFAIMERTFPGITIEEKDDQGWAWQELDKVDSQKGGAPRAQLDGLKLLAVFVQHGDNRERQQRLACLKEDVSNGVCRRPLLMVDDLGATFGKAGWTQGKTGKMNYEAWSSVPIFDPLAESDHYERTGQRACVGYITSSKLAGDTGLDKPVILEEGRKFLAGLLNQLSDQQIIDLFTVARADKLGQTVKENGTERPVTIDDWVLTFKKKRDEINERVCPQ